MIDIYHSGCGRPGFALSSARVFCAFLRSDCSRAELDAARLGLYSLIFVSPEMLVRNEELHSLLSSAVFTERLLCVAIDEDKIAFILSEFIQILFTKKGAMCGCALFWNGFSEMNIITFIVPEGLG